MAQRRAATSTTTHADRPAGSGQSGAGALERANAAWDKGDYDVAEPLYQEAVETGGLDPPEVLAAYVHLGAARSVLGKRASAMTAFKTAALIDPHFVVPPEAGKRAMALADRARQTEAKLGSLAFSADVPAEVSAGETTTAITATLDPAHLVLVNKVALSVKDPLSGRSYDTAQDAAASVELRLPQNMMLPDATLLIRVDALDAQQNRVASVSGRSHVRAAAVAAAGAGVLGAAGALALAPKPQDKNEKDHKGGGFWASPWPYVLGGVALAAGGAAIYLAVRPTNDVNVGAVHVDLTR